MSRVFLQIGHSPQRPDWLAGQTGFELRNVVAKYPIGKVAQIPGIQPNSGHRDYSRSSCGIGDTQLGSFIGSLTDRHYVGNGPQACKACGQQGWSSRYTQG